ncbi:glycoside hydrolase [Guyanagaster necrorhizus]|uniref:alpha-1,2-Mannosidase n=1 Tax=Guyanagaster necrorhizus TaxID=856835 RepID=A0A9P7VN67_9AGAR|nr:glycoside hydrolase [Guyanagaster necrorhizus MCA 3950]KAG7443547.1 glycoside hydrolase [Guyanagaster necrorhizus MCA 3950]
MPPRKQTDSSKQSICSSIGALIRSRLRATTCKYVGFFVLLFISSYLYLSPLIITSVPQEPISTDYLNADVSKRDAVRAAFQHAWSSYEQDAMGADEYHPISHRGFNFSGDGGIGYTVVDALDTMLIMGLHDEHARARQWILDKHSFEREGNFNTFETTIRVLGGLLSAYHLAGDTLYLERAVDLADRLLPAFDTPTGLPLPMVNLAKRVGVRDQWSSDQISTAEAATLQLEFKYLAQLTRKNIYWSKVENVMSVIYKSLLPHSLVPIFMSASKGDFTQSDIRLGSRGDSYYEYLIKQYLQTNRTEPIYKKMYADSMKGLHDNLVQKTSRQGLTYIAELIPHRSKDGSVTWDRSAKQDHLVCFLAGSLMLGATTSGAAKHFISIPPRLEELTQEGQRDWQTGVNLLETCMDTHRTSTGLSPEIVMFRANEEKGESERDWFIKNSRKGGPSSYDARYMLRPETVESLFIAWRLTGDLKYRQHAWNIFSAIENHCRLEEGGYATVLDVDTVPVSRDDKQETFFLSETLKYLYMTFSDSSIIPLDKYVFNTEGHPLPIFKPTDTKPAFAL